MDFIALFSGVLGKLWYFIPFIVFVTVVKSAWFKGVFGEFLVNFLLKKFLPQEQYTLIKNVTLPTENGTTQIDHIVVSQFGVFVIETKNMKGWIFGNAKQKQWTQKIFKYTGKFQNPLHQNYKHTQTLAACLDIPSELIYSVIVFIGDSTFKTKMPENVTYARGCVEYIKTKNERHFTAEQVAEIVSVIEAGRLSRGLKTNLAHNQHVKTIIQSRQSADIVSDEKENSEPVCPKCGSAMTLRVAKKGKNAGNQFWGCTNFPQCRKVIGVN
ncbi:nuclease-related domain-containing protein [Psychromonas aquimarina]|uniref:nuclease-related domain-containing protein n=1 Tax=Psychromonas aquimarina TaxID=444919 RepID=UPI000416F688|nr:NERD domain-containing protein [Psychromonas aquimarina]